MGVNFRQRASSLEQSLAQVKLDLQTARAGDRLRLLALQASLQRSLRWYRARAGSRSDIHALHAHVHDEVTTSEANA